MSYRWAVFTSTVLPLLCSGCIPIRVSECPGLAGTVLDSKTQLPLPGAKVAVAHVHPVHKDDMPTEVEILNSVRSPVVQATVDGSFQLPRAHRWSFFSLIGDTFFPDGILLVGHDGYDAVYVRIDLYGKTTNVGAILLHSAATGSNGVRSILWTNGRSINFGNELMSKI